MSTSGNGSEVGALSSRRSRGTYDLVGIGFGVTGLALAVALHETGRADNALFLERRESPGWHDGMLIEGSSMQVSFLKDIVTMRNPSSDFSFISYLHSKGRLASFINHSVLMPSRREFHDYLGWVASRLDHMVRYGVGVTDVRPIVEDGIVTALEILAADRIVARTRNLVIGTGLRPRLPDGVKTTERVWHNAEFLYRITNFDDNPPRRIIVVGAGQSAAETALHLMDRFPSTQICPVFARYGYSSVDTSPFANRIFDASGVDEFYTAPREVKQTFLRYHSNTNYSVVSRETLDALYRREYEQNVTGVSRLRIFNASRLRLVRSTEQGVLAEVQFLPTGEIALLDADLVIYATGYESRDPKGLLNGVASHLHTDDAGALLIDRDYRVNADEEFRCGIYVQGATEATHGIASTLLSVAAIRAEQIVQSLIDARGASSMPCPRYLTRC